MFNPLRAIAALIIRAASIPYSSSSSVSDAVLARRASFIGALLTIVLSFCTQRIIKHYMYNHSCVANNTKMIIVVVIKEFVLSEK